MALSFQELIRFILDGQNVDAATINRVLRDLDNNTRYLRDMFDSALSAEALFDRDVTCEEALVPGMPAYYHAGNHRYERAKAATYYDDSLLKIAESSYPWGIVSHKHNTTRCDILLCGVATLDITAALTPPDLDIDGHPIPGVYYLSGSEAGKMARQAAPVSVPVCQVGPNDSVYVRPNLADIFTRHVHYQEKLVCKPAGTANLAGGRWTITADDTKEGWLPAASFGGKAPAGAVFGYNLAKSPVGAIWPPLPLEGVYVAWDRGLDPLVAATGVPMGPYGLLTVDESGLWWHSDLDNDVPWPADYATAPDPPPPSLPPETPRLLQMQMALYFTKPVYQTSDTVVTSLTTESPIVSITCAEDGRPAVSGALQIDVDFGLAVQVIDDPASHALKTLNPDGTITQGPVVVGIKSGDPLLHVESNSPDLEDGYKTGLIVLTPQQSPIGGELPIVEVKLDGATLENYKNIMSLGLLKGRDSSFRGEYHIPKQINVAGKVKTKIRLWLLGRAAGTLPELQLSAMIIPQPPADFGNEGIPTIEDFVVIDTSQTIAKDTYIEVESVEILADPGDSIQFTFSRDAEVSDGYDGDILVMKRLAVIVA